MNPFYFALAIYSLFWRLNYSNGISVYVRHFTENFPEKVKYALSCILCFSFWLSLAIVPFTQFPWWIILVAPAINLFLHSIYLYLTQ